MRQFVVISLALFLMLACEEEKVFTGIMRDNISAVEMVRDMGIGVNIGNTLDSIYDGDAIAGETGWGNPEITRDFIRALKKHGYKTIRLPVTWAEHLGPAPDYEIAEAWLARVEQRVNWCLAEGLYVIVNIHHDGGESEESWILNAANDLAGVTEQFAAVWRQIARRFSGASDYLILESMNEVGFNRIDRNRAYDTLNSLNQTFVNTVRSTRSNNASRFLLIAGYYTDIDQTCDVRFLMPQDTTSDRLILSIHYYTPSTFCIAERPDNSWGFRDDWGSEATAASDTAELDRYFDKLKIRFLTGGVPIILGEYGVTRRNKIEAGRVRWITAVTQICIDNGICPVLWDIGLKNGGEIQRETPYNMGDTLKQVWASIIIPGGS
jgi:endoglucanase